MSIKQEIVNYIALDLELNQPSKKIIQVGIVCGNIYTGEILHKQGWFINPHEPLSQYIIDLTKITQDDVNSGVSLLDAYQDLQSIRERFNAHRSLITWGQGDCECLKEQLGDIEWAFGRRYWDVKTITQFDQLRLRKSTQGGLARILVKHGMAFKGQKHNAIDDALNTFLLFTHLINKT